MIRTAILVAAALALAGCADENTAQSSGQSPGDAQMMMLLGTGFLNGYNGVRQTQPVVSTHCAAIGAVVNCLSF